MIIECPYCGGSYADDRGLTAWTWFAGHLLGHHSIRPWSDPWKKEFVCECGLMMSAEPLIKVHIRNCPAFELLRLEAALQHGRRIEE